MHIQRTVPHRTSIRTSSFSRLINFSWLKHLRAKKRNFIPRWLTDFQVSFSRITKKTSFKYSGADSGLVKLGVMTNVFFKYDQREIEIKRLICVKWIRSGFFSNSWNQLFYTWYVQKVKIGIHRKLNFQPNLAVQRLKKTVGVKRYFKI